MARWSENVDNRLYSSLMVVGPAALIARTPQQEKSSYLSTSACFALDHGIDIPCTHPGQTLYVKGDGKAALLPDGGADGHVGSLPSRLIAFDAMLRIQRPNMVVVQISGHGATFGRGHHDTSRFCNGPWLDKIPVGRKNQIIQER